MVSHGNGGNMGRSLSIILLVLLSFGVADARLLFVGSVTSGATTSGGGDDGLNDFSGDSNAFAVYNYESGALDTDSKGGNTWGECDGNPSADGADFKQGSASSDWTAACRAVQDGDLDANFPLKLGDSQKTISMAAWVKFDTDPSDEELRTIWSKYNSGTTDRTMMWGIALTGGNTVARVHIGYNSGASNETVSHATDLAQNTWYHITITYDDSDKGTEIRVRDTSCDTVGSDVDATPTLDGNKLFVGDAEMVAGGFNDSATWPHDGHIDELVVFDDILTETESTKICNGTYP